MGIQTGIFVLWLIQFAGFMFALVEFVNARANVTHKAWKQWQTRAESPPASKDNEVWKQIL